MRFSSETIYLAGFREDPNTLLAGSDLFVLFSKVEGLPGVVLEAARQRVPAMAIDVGAISEVIVNNETGVLLGGHDVELFSTRLIELIDNEPLRTSMGKKAYELVSRAYSPEEMVRQFLTLYTSLSHQTKTN
jgi:L-malate glycosyltransferase